MIKELVTRNRSCRRFEQSYTIDEGTLKGLVDMARLTPSTGNLQPLKYILSCEPERNGMIFENLAWAGYLKDWPGPAEGERPSAYIVIVRDTRISTLETCDHGMAAMTILLGAVELGLAGCTISVIKRDSLARSLHLGGHLEILLVLALGKPAEEIRMDKVGADGDIKYWRDDQGVHHVPKRDLEEIILKLQ